LNKVDLVAGVAEKAGITKRDAERAVNAFCEAVEEALARGERVSLVGFGTFEVRSRQARQGRNPQTGQTIEIPAGRVPVFKAGKSLKDSVEG
jgi:DNA-binding protein HU-beta